MVYICGVVQMEDITAHSILKVDTSMCGNCFKNI